MYVNVYKNLDYKRFCRKSDKMKNMNMFLKLQLGNNLNLSFSFWSKNIQDESKNFFAR